MVAYTPLSRPAALLVALVVAAVPAWAQSASKAPAKPAQTVSGATLAYKLKAGQTVIYSVTIQVDGASSVETLSGPAAYKVTSSEDGNTLQFQTALQTKRRLKEGADEATAVGSLANVRRFGLFRPGSAGADNTLKIDQYGYVLRQSGDSNLPSFLGNLSRLLLEPLPGKPAGSWDSNTDGNLAVTGKEGADRILLASREKVTCTLKDGPGLPVVEKRYEMATRETVGGEPRVKMTGQGRTTFDPKAGLPTEIHFDGTVAEASRNSVSKTLLNITCKLLEGKDREIALQELGAGRYASDDADPPVRDPDLLAALNMLKAADKSARKSAADKLASWPPNENRARVARALASALGDSDLFVRWSAVKALGVWYTKETVPDIIKRLDDPEHAVRWEAEKQLGDIKDERACMPLAIMVDKGTDRDFAANALEAMGPVAEDVAIKLLGSYAWEARNRAAKMLAKWGTKEAVPTLRLHLRDTNGIVAMASQDALKNIAARNP